jgi:hypothetical protein
MCASPSPRPPQPRPYTPPKDTSNEDRTKIIERRISKTLKIEENKISGHLSSKDAGMSKEEYKSQDESKDNKHDQSLTRNKSVTSIVESVKINFPPLDSSLLPDQAVPAVTSTPPAPAASQAFLQSLKRALSSNSQPVVEDHHVPLIAEFPFPPAPEEKRVECAVDIKSRVPFIGLHRSLFMETNRKLSSVSSTDLSKAAVHSGTTTALSISELVVLSCRDVERRVANQLKEFCKIAKEIEDESASKFLADHQYQQQQNQLQSINNITNINLFTSNSHSNRHSSNQGTNGSSGKGKFGLLDELFTGEGNQQHHELRQKNNTSKYALNNNSSIMTGAPFNTPCIDSFESSLMQNKAPNWCMKDVQDILHNAYACKIKGLQYSISQNTSQLYTKITKLVKQLQNKHHSKQLEDTNQILIEYYRHGEQKVYHQLACFEEVLNQKVLQHSQRVSEEVTTHHHNWKSKKMSLIEWIDTSYQTQYQQYLEVIKNIYYEHDLHEQCHQQLLESIHQYGMNQYQMIQNGKYSLKNQHEWQNDLKLIDDEYNKFYERSYAKLQELHEAPPEHNIYLQKEEYTTKYHSIIIKMLRNRRKQIESCEERLNYVELVIEGYYLSLMEELCEYIQKLQVMKEEAYIYNKQLKIYCDQENKKVKGPRVSSDQSHASSASGTTSVATSLTQSSPSRKPYQFGRTPRSNQPKGGAGKMEIAILDDGDVESWMRYYSCTRGSNQTPIFKMGTKIRLLAELAHLSLEETEGMMLQVLQTCQREG